MEAAKAQRANNNVRVIIDAGIVGLLGLLVLINTRADPVPSPPAIRVTAEDLASAYRIDEVSAAERFGGHGIEVSGTVQLVEHDILGNLTIEMEGENFFMSPRATISGDSEARAGSLRSGQRVTLRCESLRESVGTVLLADCGVI